MARKAIGIAAVALVVGLGALIWWDAQVRVSPESAVPDLNDSDRIAFGRVVYLKHCASCHGAQLEGQPNWRDRLPNGKLPAPPHDDSGHTWHHTFDLLFAMTKHGLVPPYAPPGYQSEMPGFGDQLSDDEIWNVLAYIRSRWSDRVRSTHDELQRQQAAQRGG